MSLDKNLYRQAYEQYRQWNEAKTIARAQNAGRLSPLEAWQKYVALVEFCWRLQPNQSQQQREQRLADWDRYYARIQRFEARRGAHGKTA